jgi:hypothetical protein
MESYCTEKLESYLTCMDGNLSSTRIELIRAKMDA